MCRAQRQQLAGEHLQIQVVDLAYGIDGVLRPAVHAVTGSGDRAGHRSNGVAVAVERRGSQAGLPRVIGVQREHREGGSNRFLCRNAGADQLRHIAH